MSALTDPEIAYLQSELGTTLDLSDLELRFTRLGSAVAVADEVVRIRLADAIAAGPGFSIPGVYSEQSPGDIIKALQAQSARLAAAVAAEAAAAEADRTGGSRSSRLVRTDRSR